jgi:hypothetical protein
MDPDEQALIGLLAQLWLRHGVPEKARTLLRGATKLAPGEPELLKLLAWAEGGRLRRRRGGTRRHRALPGGRPLRRRGLADRADPRPGPASRRPPGRSQGELRPLHPAPRGDRLTSLELPEAVRPASGKARTGRESRHHRCCMTFLGGSAESLGPQRPAGVGVPSLPRILNIQETAPTPWHRCRAGALARVCPMRATPPAAPAASASPRTAPGRACPGAGTP